MTCRSMDSLENRGLVIETEQSHQSNDPFYSRTLPHPCRICLHRAQLQRIIEEEGTWNVGGVELQGWQYTPLNTCFAEIPSCWAVGRSAFYGRSAWNGGGSLQALQHTGHNATMHAPIRKACQLIAAACAEMMKNVNTVQYDELSTDQIAAARQRRSQDRSAKLKKGK